MQRHISIARQPRSAVTLAEDTERNQSGYVCLVSERSRVPDDEKAAVPPIVDEAGVVERLRTGDDAAARDAFAVIFNAYYGSVVRFVDRYVTGRDAAEDVAQDAFVRVWERRAAVESSGSIRALLFATARNRALDLLEHDAVVRAHAKRTMARYADGAETPTAPAADASLLEVELAQLAATHVAALPPRQREIYQLSREDGLSPSEIAEVLGIAPATVYVQMARIVHALFPALAAWTTDA